MNIFFEKKKEKEITHKAMTQSTQVHDPLLGPEPPVENRSTRLDRK